MLGRFSCAFKDCWGSDNRKEIVVAIWHPEIRNRLRIYRHWERPCLNQKFFALDGAVLGRLAADTWRRCRRVTICGKPKPRRMRYAESLKNLDELDESQNKFQIFSNERIVCISLHCLHCLHLSLGDIRQSGLIMRRCHAWNVAKMWMRSEHGTFTEIYHVHDFHHGLNGFVLRKEWYLRGFRRLTNCIAGWRLIALAMPGS